jgi:hypothetical protein
VPLKHYQLPSSQHNAADNLNIEITIHYGENLIQQPNCKPMFKWGREVWDRQLGAFLKKREMLVLKLSRVV